MQTMGELVERNAHYFANREAFVQGERRLTHAQFAERARRLASGSIGSACGARTALPCSR